MCRFSTVKKKFFNVLLVLAIMFIAGSCKQPENSTRLPESKKPHESTPKPINETPGTVPVSSIPADATLILSVSESVGGNAVRGSIVEAYEAGSSTPKARVTTDVNGNAGFVLERGKAYDFVLSGKGAAGSRLENYYLPEGSEATSFAVVQRLRSVNASPLAPKTLTVQYAKPSGSSYTQSGAFYNGQEMDESKIASEGGGIYVETRSARPINNLDELRVTHTNELNLGILCGVGGKVSMQHVKPSAITDTDFLAKAVKIDGKDMCIDSDGMVRQAWFFDLSGARFLSGAETIYLIAYDVNGNRLEHHINVNIKNGSLKKEASTIKFKSLHATLVMQTGETQVFAVSPHEVAQPFAAKGHGAYKASYRTAFDFEFNSHTTSIARVELYRRKNRGSEAITEGFELVYTKTYPKPTTGSRFMIADESLTLEEGEFYQYKLVAFDAYNGTITSPVVTVGLFPSFHVELVYPRPESQITQADLNKNGFQFKISNPELWNAQWADVFRFGLAVFDPDSYADLDNDRLKVSYGIYYSTKAEWDFTKTGNDRLKVMTGLRTGYGPYDTAEDTYSSVTVDPDTLVSFDKTSGIVTIKPAFLQNTAYNKAVNKGTGFTADPITALIPNTLYYWDVLEWGINAGFVYDNKPAYFYKNYPLLNAETGAELSTTDCKGGSLCVSAANIEAIPTAMNGRATFMIVEP